MKKTNVCEMCGKRYKFPSDCLLDERREHICFTCEVSMEMVQGMLTVLRLKRPLSTLEDWAGWYNLFITWKSWKDDNTTGTTD